MIILSAMSDGISIIIMLGIIAVLVFVCLFVIKLIFSKPKQSMMKDMQKSLRETATLQNKFGLKNLYLEGDRRHPPVKIGKITGVVSHIPIKFGCPKCDGMAAKKVSKKKVFFKCELCHHEFDIAENEQFEDVLVIKIKDLAIFSWMPMLNDIFKKEILLRLLEGEHSKFVQNGDVFVYAVAIRSLGNSGFYITSNRSESQAMTNLYDQSTAYAFKSIVDGVGVIANKVPETNVQNIMMQEKKGGILKILKGGIK